MDKDILPVWSGSTHPCCSWCKLVLFRHFRWSSCSWGNLRSCRKTLRQQHSNRRPRV